MNITHPRGDDAKLDVMAQLPVFDGCSRKQLRLAAQLFDAAVLPARTVVLQDDDHGRWLFVLADGSALVGRDHHPTQIMEPGGCWGHRMFFERRPEPWTIEALSSVIVLSIDRRNFATLERLMPTVAVRLRRSSLRALGPAGGGLPVAPSRTRSEVGWVA